MLKNYFSDYFSEHFQDIYFSNFLKDIISSKYFGRIFFQAVGRQWVLTHCQKLEKKTGFQLLPLKRKRFNPFRLYCLILFVLNSDCKTVQTENLIYKSESILVYELKSSSVEFRNPEILFPIFLELYKSKDKKEKIILLENFEKIIPILNKKTNYLIIQKIEDSISPYTRFLRTSFELNLQKENIEIYFFEIDKSFNLGTNIEFQDWAVLQNTEKKCNSFPKVFFDKKGMEYKKLENCKNQFYFLEIDKDKFFAPETIEKKIKPSAELRLEKLKLLLKKGLISKEDYELKKAEILGEL